MNGYGFFQQEGATAQIVGKPMCVLQKLIVNDFIIIVLSGLLVTQSDEVRLSAKEKLQNPSNIRNAVGEIFMKQF